MVSGIEEKYRDHGSMNWWWGDRIHLLGWEATLKKAMLRRCKSLETGTEGRRRAIQAKGIECAKFSYPGLYLMPLALISSLYSRGENRRILVSDRPESEFQFHSY